MPVTKAPAIRCTDVTVDLAGSTVLRGVDWTVQPGEFAALLGPNGSGKSTLIRALLRLVPSGGSIEIFGTPLAKRHALSQCGYVPQRAGTVSGVPATVSEVVASGILNGHRLIGWPNRSERQRINEAIASVGLATQRSALFAELSGGQQQRVLIARALVTSPSLLIMDEPTVGIDAASIEVLAELLGERKNAGTTIVMVSHDIAGLTHLIDTATVLQHGNIVHTGSADELDGDHSHDHPHSSEPNYSSFLTTEGPLA